MTAAVRYDRPMKNYIDELSATGHVTHKAYRKTSVTFHHNAGRLSHEGVLSVWQKRPASAHFNVDGKGTACQYVKPNEYAWATGSAEGNRTSISIEMANSATGGDWPVAEITWKSAARLAGWLFAKVIGARPSKANVHFHSRWSATACAGPYMKSVYDRLLAEVVRAYEYFTAAARPPAPPRAPVARKSSTQIAAEVWAGKWGSGDDRARRLKAAGYDPKAIQALVNRGVGRAVATRPSTAQRKTVTEIAREVIAGKWGNDPTRRTKLAKAGYNPTTVQREVNRLL